LRLSLRMFSRIEKKNIYKGHIYILLLQIYRQTMQLRCFHLFGLG